MRAQLAADPRRVAGDVHHRAQQRGDAEVVERGGDGGVVVRERTAGVRVVGDFGHGPETTTARYVQPMSTENLSSTEYRLADLERRMNAVVAHLGLDFPPLAGGEGPSAEVVALAVKGDTTGAAKLHREQTGCDMATAMRVVQELG